MVRSDDGEAAASGDASSNPASDLTNKGVDAAKEGAEKAKTVIEKGVAQLKKSFETPTVLGDFKSRSETPAK